MSLRLRPSDVRARILGEHVEIRRLIDALEELAAEEAATGVRVPGRFGALRGRLLEYLLAHIDVENALLVPALRELDAWGQVRAEALLRHHEEQRAWLASLLAATTAPPPVGAELVRWVSIIAETLRDDMAHEERDLLHANLLRDDLVVLDAFGG